jgi:TonB family protein
LLRKQISINIISGFINNWESYLLNFKINEGKNEYVGTDAIFLENTSYNSSISTTNESIVNAKKGYQFALNKNSLDIDLQFPKAFQLVGEYSWNDVKNLSQLESIEDYTIQSSGDKIYREIKEKSINEKSEEREDEIFTAVEQQAEFPGGPGAWRRYLIKSLKYPSAARRANVGGRVFVSFVVNTDGSVSDIQILKGVGFGCDEEAIRLIKSMPRWNPGKQSGRAVRSRFTQPITFVANDEESDN